MKRFLIVLMALFVMTFVGCSDLANGPTATITVGVDLSEINRQMKYDKAVSYVQGLNDYIVEIMVQGEVDDTTIQELLTAFDQLAISLGTTSIMTDDEFNEFFEDFEGKYKELKMLLLSYL